LNIMGLQTSATTDSIVTIDAATGQLRRTTMAIIGANSVTVDNGLTKTGSNVRLGGSLLTPTAINVSAANTLSLGGLQGGTLATDSVLTTTAGGVVQRMSMAQIGANAVTVGNGLTKTGNNITFGGPLTAATSLNTSTTNTLSIGGLTTGTATDSILTTGANGLVRRVSINDLAAASPDFWLDGAGIRPDGTTDNTERVYRTGDVGIGSAAVPTSKLQVTGSVGLSITTTTADLTIDATHHTIIANCTGGAVNLTLPTASTCTGRVYYITKSDETTNLMSFNTALKLTETTNVLSYNYTKRLTIQSDGANWRVISE
jgi:trimeric autotransporter adhesin